MYEVPINHIGKKIVDEAKGFKEVCDKANMCGEHFLDTFWVDGVKVEVKMFYGSENDGLK